MTDEAATPRRGLIRAGGRAVLALGVAAGALPAQASTSPTSLSVQTVVPVSCTVSVSDVTFASPMGLNISQTDADGAATVTCTNGGGYTLFDQGGQHDDANGVHYMQQGTLATGVYQIAYRAFRDSARTIGLASPGYNFYSAVSTGSPVSVPIYFRMSQQAAPAAGDYADTYKIGVNF